MPDVAEAKLERVGSGLAPVTDGWFVVNARDAAWIRHDTFGVETNFELSGPVARAGDGIEPRRFEQLGIGLHWLEPGQPSTLYHAEPGNQENFLVLAGECRAVIEGEERLLRQWDFVHCPPATEHTIVGAGSTSCVLVGVGAREHQPTTGWHYPVNELALRHHAGVRRETSDMNEAYADLPDRPTRYGDDWLPTF